MIVLLSINISGGDEKYKFKVIAEKPGSIITSFYVYSKSSEDAKEEVSLNGWKVISVERIESTEYKQKVDNGVVKNALQTDFAKLKLIKTFYFDKGAFSFNLDNDTINFIKSLDKNKVYYIYGHTDSLPVNPNDKYKNNYELSILRAKFVKDLLKKYADIDENAKIVGLGEFYPLVSNSFEGAVQNRRVELYESD
ncbi:OmpA family protein [Deferribacter autotrophicus]|uniref:OmpA family protein n=1 Tax=Deferribacter autotrophicus TaxID=500465 RepID=UPI00165EA4E6|nr:OmpA family protein [Deferribacter autotrophicus]